MTNKTHRALLALIQIGNTLHHLNKKTEQNCGLSLAQWCVLNRLIDMPAAPANLLAKEVGVHPSTLTQTLKRLERKHCIFMIHDPKDSRKKIISITREGRDLYHTTSDHLQSWSKELNPLTDDLSCIQTSLNLQSG
jgi:DNA-binding MarR family transcriptional regulator